MHHPEMQHQIKNTNSIQLTKSYYTIHGFYLRYPSKPKMLNDILPLADPKSSSDMRRNTIVWSVVLLYLT